MDDLDQAVEHIAGDNAVAAKQVATRIWKASHLLAEQPSMGRPGRISGTREWVIDGTSYIMAYRVREEVLEVLRVIHGARQWPRDIGNG